MSLSSLLWHNYVPPASLVFRRTVHDEVGGYDESLAALEDWEFLLRVLVRGPVGFLGDQTLAAWHLTAQPVEVAELSSAAELLVRDRFLRRDLGADPQGPTGLGLPLFLTHHLSVAADRWGRAHQDHLDVVTTELRLELARLRGEMLLVREMFTEFQEDIALLGVQVEEAMKTTRAVDALRAGRPPRERFAVRAARSARRRLSAARDQRRRRGRPRA